MSEVLRSLGDICEFKYGKSLPASSRDGGEFDVYGSNGIVGTHSETITSGPTIVIGRKGSIGELNYSQKSCWPIDTTYYVDTSCTSADLRWLNHALSSLRLTEMNKSAAIPGLNRNDAYEKKLKVPSLSEQRRIAAILDKAEALRSKRREAIAKLDQLLQSVFLEMFGDALAKPKAEVVPLHSTCHLITDGTHQSPTWVDNGIPFIFQSHVKPGSISLDVKKYISLDEYQTLTARKPIEINDILYTIVGSYGNAAMVRSEQKFCFQRHIAHIKVKSIINPEFLEAQMNQEFIKKQADLRATGIAQRTLILKELKDIKIILPSIDAQNSFVNFYRKIRKSSDEQKFQLNKLDTFCESLNNKFFTQ